MLLSARAGDEIRISMFGGTGYEIVRAMQLAVAKGANIKIAFDRKLGHGLTSWIRDSILNVYSPNPYLESFKGVTPGKISVRVSTWTGKNHYKAGTLTRRQQDGSMVAEQIIVGSQNWSSGGNDFNDENLISIQNVKFGVKAAEAFNHEFDTRLWVKSKEETPRVSK
jgi:phosphatidylserine/phosphatidylglycerophosphate/cardiolipin synthase-like enzyme